MFYEVLLSHILLKKVSFFVFYFFTDKKYKFNQNDTRCGFAAFIPLMKLYYQNTSYLLGDYVRIGLVVGQVIDCSTFPAQATCLIGPKQRIDDSTLSKQVTGFVGLKKQGNEDDINSLLQTLYHIPFRKVSVCTLFICLFFFF